MINSKQDLTNHQIAHSIMDIVHTLYQQYLNSVMNSNEENNMTAFYNPWNFSEFADADEIESELSSDKYQDLPDFVNSDLIQIYRSAYEDLINEIAQDLHAKDIPDMEMERPAYEPER